MPFIILDRDGVINYDSDFYIKNPDEYIFVPGSLDAIARLTAAGYRILIATNQSGVARGYYTLETLEKIHDKLRTQVEAAGGHIEAIYFCPHHPDEDCPCRKPKPGMFRQIERDYEIDFSKTYFVGDSLTDTLVATAVGCKPMLVLTSKGNVTLTKHPELARFPHFADLSQAVDYILTPR